MYSILHQGILIRLHLNQILYYALHLSYYSSTEAVLFACLSSSWATTAGRLPGPKLGNSIKGRVHWFSMQVVMKCFFLILVKNFGADSSSRF